MNRRAVITLVVLFMAALLPSHAMAGWQKLEPQVVGGSLTPRWAMTFIQVSKDEILLFGGRQRYTFADTWLYDVSDNRWTKQTNLNITESLGKRAHAAFASIGEDRVLMMGGWRYRYTYLDETWLYDHSQQKWTKLYPSIEGTGWTGRGHAGMAYLGDDKVILFGGYKYSGYHYNDTWIYDLSDNTWTNTAPTVSGGELAARHSMNLARVGDGKVIGFGGWDGSKNLDETWLYDEAANTWTQVTPTVNGGVLPARHAAALTYIGGDQVLMFGGIVASGATSENDFWLFDLSENSWTLIESPADAVPSVRGYLGLTAVGQGQVVLFGGRQKSTYHGDTWIYTMPDSAISTFSATPDSAGVELSWSHDTELTGNTYYIYKNNAPLSEAITTGTEDGGRTLFSYVDNNTTSGTLIRYKLLEVNSTLNSEVFSDEIVVPYCN